MTVFSVFVTLILQFDDTAFGIVQAKLPVVAGVEVVIELQMLPLFVENSNLTFETLDDVHVIL